MASEQEKRKLSELRVVDLRSELEQRGMDKTGVKAVLIDRLIKVLEEEGHDPEAYVFEPPAKSVVVPKRGQVTKSRSDFDTESESQSNADETHDLTLDVDEDLKEDCKSEDAKYDKPSSTLSETTSTKLATPTTEVNTKIEDTFNTSLIIDEDADISEEKPEITHIDIPKVTEEEMKDEEKENVVVKSEPMATLQVEEKKPAKVTGKNMAKKPASIKIEAPVISTEMIKTEVDKIAPDANGVDNEDSINLDIGEDEEKLLADEDDSCISQDKENKDVHGDRVDKSQVTNKESTKDEERKSSSAADENAKTQEEVKDEKTKSSSADQKAKDDKDKGKKVGGASSHHSRNLWVSGLSSATRATDLKVVFSKFGKVVGAKVVTNALTPGARCYGYVTMSTNEEANKCIHYLHRTELHGRMISVERAKDNSNPQKRDFKPSVLDRKRHDRKFTAKSDEKKGTDEAKKEVAKPDPANKPKGSDEKAKVDDGEKDKEVKEGASDKEKAGSVNKEKNEKKPVEVKEKRRISAPRSHSPHRRISPARKPRQPIQSLLTFAQIRDERARNRLRERERELREEERRGKELLARQREIERRQREEALRLEKEKEKLRQERERIELERIELLRLERERQRLELERQREELHRQQLSRYAETRRPAKRPADDRRDAYPEERKRIATDRRFEQPAPRFEESRSSDFPAKKEARRGGGNNNDFAPPPPRRSEPAKFDRAGGGVLTDGRLARRDAAHEVPRRESVHEIPRRGDHAANMADVPRNKDNRETGRFDRTTAPSFRVRDDRRPDADHRSKVDPRQSNRDRYADSSKPSFSSSSSKDGRYMDRTGSTWHTGNSGAAPIKPYSGGSLSSAVMAPRDSWSSSDRKSESQSWSRGPAQIQRTVESAWAMGSAPQLSRGGPSMYTSSSQNMPQGLSSMGASSGGQYNSDRFDSYKPSLGQIRKY